MSEKKKPSKVAPAIIADMPMEEYQARTDALSKSMISAMDCPAKFKYEYIDNGKREEGDHFSIGTAVHTLALEPEQFEARFHILPAVYVNGKGETATFRKDPRMQIYKDELAKAGDKTILDHADYIDVQSMAASLIANPTAVALLKRPGLIEPSIFWTDEETGLQHKCRPDFLGDDGLVIDIKTGKSAKPSLFQKDAFELKYDLSVALTSRGVKALRGSIENYVFILIEKTAPFVVECYDAFRPWQDATEDMAAVSYHDVGAHRLDIYIARYRECLKTGVWPGYNGGKIMPMSVPSWAMKQLEKETA